ncbi:HutD [compost metagenome]
MRLKVDGHLSRDLTALDAFAFDGGSAVDCELLDGPIRDFNLIYSPQRYAARLQWLWVEGETRFFSSAGILLLFAAEAGASLAIDGQAPTALGRHDCLQLESAGALAELKLSGTGVVCLIELMPR